VHHSQPEAVLGEGGDPEDYEDYEEDDDQVLDGYVEEPDGPGHKSVESAAVAPERFLGGPPPIALSHVPSQREHL